MCIYYLFITNEPYKMITLCEPLLHYCRSPHFILKLKLLCKSNYKYIKQFEIEYPKPLISNITMKMSILEVKERLMESLECNCRACMKNLQNIDKTRNKELIPELTIFAIENNLHNIMYLDSYDDNKLSNIDITNCIICAIQHNEKDAKIWINYIFNMYKINNIKSLQLASPYLTINSVNNYMNCNTISCNLNKTPFDILFPYFCNYNMENYMITNFVIFDNNNYLELTTIIFKDIKKWTKEFIETVFVNYLKTRNVNFDSKQNIIKYSVNNKHKSLILAILTHMDLDLSDVDLLFPLIVNWIENWDDFVYTGIIENNKNLVSLFNIKAIKMNCGRLYLNTLTENEILQILTNTTNPIFIKKCNLQLITILDKSSNKILDENFMKTFFEYIDTRDIDCTEIINEYILSRMK